jgi:hypothetical protein
MKTTNFFIELLVIGLGAVITISLLLFVSVDYNVFRLNFDNAFFIFPFTALTYVLGIVCDRIFDSLSERWDKKARLVFWHPKDLIGKQDANGDKVVSDEDANRAIKLQYEIARTKLYDRSDAAKQVFDYTRSRLRICRSWMFYLFIICFCFIIIFLKKNADIFLLLSFLSFCLGMMTWFAWKKINHSFYGRLKTIEQIYSTE